MTRSFSPNRHAQQILFTLTLFIVCLISFSNEASAVSRRGKLSAGGTYKILANGCLLKVTSANTSLSIQIRCDGSGSFVNNARNRTGILYLRRGDRATFTGENCTLRRTLTRKARIDIRCDAAVTPTATPTATVTSTPTSTPTPNANALLAGNQLVAFNTGHPGGATAASTITGITAGETLVAIDRRPQNGMLYGLGYNATAKTLQLYIISSDTAVAAAVGATGTFVASDGVTTVPIGGGSGTQFDMDFNPNVDRIRVVTSTNGSGVGQNFRINPNTGAFVDGDLGGSGGSVTGLNMDGPVNGTTTTVQGAAYTNNEANAAATTLYTLDASADVLCVQSSPNEGLQGPCQTLSPALDAVLGFDIKPGVNTAVSNVGVFSGVGYGVVRVVGSTTENLATIDLASGAITIPATNSTIGSNTSGILSIAIQEPFGTSMIALSSAGDAIRRFNSNSTTIASSTTVTGLNGSEALVGMAYRPADGALYALGINAGADTGTLYRVDPLTAALTTIGSTGLVAFVDASSATIDLPAASTGYGFGFNPSADRIRVVTATGLNFRLNPNTGAPIDSDSISAGTQPDTALNGATTAADAAAYTNGSTGQALTTLYVLDAASNALYTQSSPNGGLTTAAVPITLGGAALDFTAINSFDIPFSVRVTTLNSNVTSGSGYAALTVGGTTSLYSIDLVNGVATKIGNIGTGTVGMIGLAVAQTTVN